MDDKVKISIIRSQRNRRFAIIFVCLVIVSILSFEGTLYINAIFEKNKFTLENLYHFTEENFYIKPRDHTQGAMVPPTGATFLFLMGVEGTGHHLFHHLLQKSLLSDNSLSKKFFDKYAIHEKFYHDPRKKPGLYSSPCTRNPANGTFLFDEVVDLMKMIDEKVRSEEVDTAIIPLNAVGEGFMNSYPSVGPGLGGACRPLLYPDIDLTYAACEKAGVQCKHILIYRDPYEVIRSTTMNRNFNPKHRQIKTLTTMLDVMNTQILTYPENLYACWNYNEGADTILDIGKLLGWDNEEFKNVYSDLFHKPEPLVNQERTNIIPSDLQPFMDTLVRAMARVETSCDSILKTREIR